MSILYFNEKRDDATFSINDGYGYMASKKYKKAINQLEIEIFEIKTKKFIPKNYHDFYDKYSRTSLSFKYYLKGFANYKLNEYKKAIENYDSALVCTTDRYPFIYYEMANSYYMLSDTNRACANWYQSNDYLFHKGALPSINDTLDFFNVNYSDTIKIKKICDCQKNMYLDNYALERGDSYINSGYSKLNNVKIDNHTNIKYEKDTKYYLDLFYGDILEVINKNIIKDSLTMNDLRKEKLLKICQNSNSILENMIKLSKNIDINRLEISSKNRITRLELIITF